MPISRKTGQIIKLNHKQQTESKESWGQVYTSGMYEPLKKNVFN